MNKDIKTFKQYLNTYTKSKGFIKLLIGDILTEKFIYNKQIQFKQEVQK